MQMWFEQSQPVELKVSATIYIYKALWVSLCTLAYNQGMGKVIKSKFSGWLQDIHAMVLSQKIVGHGYGARKFTLLEVRRIDGGIGGGVG